MPSKRGLPWQPQASAEHEAGIDTAPFHLSEPSLHPLVTRGARAVNERFPIGHLAELTGVKVPTVRYYEQIGLLPAPPRTNGNRRLYAAKDARRLTFIRHARELGFEIDAIRTLLTLQDDPGQSCAAADIIARARLREVEQRIASLQALRVELGRMVEG